MLTYAVFSDKAIGHIMKIVLMLLLQKTKAALLWLMD